MEKFISGSEELAVAVREAQEGDVLLLSGGVYPAKLLITAPNVTIRGAGAEKTVITGAESARDRDENGLELGTFRTFTVCAAADGISLYDLTVENASQNPAENGQCVALSVMGSRFRAENCRFLSTQDTLFCGPLPDDLVTRYIDFLPEIIRYREGRKTQRFLNCEIVGSVDFIFGCGEASFYKCKIVSINDGRNGGSYESFVCAPAHSLACERGFAFLNCDFENRGCSEGSVYLARPWRDYGLCVFLRCREGRHISPLGFDKWNDTERNRTARFHEYECKSEAGFSERVKWVKAEPEAYYERLIAEIERLSKE